MRSAIAGVVLACLLVLVAAASGATPAPNVKGIVVRTAQRCPVGEPCDPLPPAAVRRVHAQWARDAGEARSERRLRGASCRRLLRRLDRSAARRHTGEPARAAAWASSVRASSSAVLDKRGTGLVGSDARGRCTGLRDPDGRRARRHGRDRQRASGIVRTLRGRPDVHSLRGDLSRAHDGRSCSIRHVREAASN